MPQEACSTAEKSTKIKKAHTKKKKKFCAVLFCACISESFGRITDATSLFTVFLFTEILEIVNNNLPVLAKTIFRN